MLAVSSLVAAQATAPQKPAAPQAAAPAAAPAPAAKAAAPAQAAPQVGPGDAVITLEGVCKAKGASGACRTIVTRAQFEQMLASFPDARPPKSRQMSPADKGRLAMSYGNFLALETAFVSEGLDKVPENQEFFRFQHLRTVAQFMSQILQQRAEPAPEEIQKYYNDNPQQFEELTLERILVPITMGEDKSNEAEMKKIAEDIHKRAASGGDFAALQAEAYDKAGEKAAAPETKIKLPPSSLPAYAQIAATFKPGDVSQVLQDESGFYIYKLIDRSQIPLDKATPEIRSKLVPAKQKQLFEAAHATQSSVTLNNAYFGSPATSRLATPGAGVPPQPAK
jgi:hypothetical protein